ncbi:MAG: hypothetical protein II521_04225, partial [Prevotella sp.]|nr:hypothetical protein [Prevotella sp.]
MVTYSTEKGVAANMETITAQRAKDIIEMNKQGHKPLSLTEDGNGREMKAHTDLLAEADISRFDKSKRKKKKGGNRNATNKQNANNAPRKEGKPKANDANQEAE